MRALLLTFVQDPITPMRSTCTLSTILAGMMCSAQAPVGPDAPGMSITYDGSALTFALSNPPGSNNANGMYVEAFVPVDPTPDPYWRFQGYAIYELTPGDADDSLTYVIQDLDRAALIGWTDVTDTVLSAWNNFILAGDSCVDGPWQFDNDGPITTMATTVSALTGMPWQPTDIYCFVATAFATTPHFMHPECGTEQTMLFSRVLTAQCITPATVGMAEHTSGSISIGPNPTSDVLHVRTSGGIWEATCLDALGRAVRQQRINAVDVISVTDLSAGVYRLMLREQYGQMHSAAFVVQR